VLCFRYSDKLQALDSRYAAADAAREQHPGWAAASKEDKDELLEEEKEERYLERLDAGLYTLQLLAALLASVWVSQRTLSTAFATCALPLITCKWVEMRRHRGWRRRSSEQ
jgi:hypothetical protein